LPGTPVRFWGINISYSHCAPPKKDAARLADFYARRGINLVRLHKYADGPGFIGIQDWHSFQKFDPAALDRMDYFAAQLKTRGIYIALSPTFGVNLGRDDEAAVPYMRELGEFRGNKEIGQRIYTRHGAIYLSRELQDMQIGQTTRLLAHRNPYTGVTWAEEPAIAVIEFFNEDSALYSGVPGRLRVSPTLRRRAAALFTAWLQKHYTTPAALLKAWGGAAAVNAFATEGTGDEFAGESADPDAGWDAVRLLPLGHPDWFTPDALAPGGARHAHRRRLLDTMRFLYELQNHFYDRFQLALRKTGYDGETLSSNWVAGRAASHYYNLHSDARFGIVDRHNYYRGPGNSMLDTPGRGLLGLGLQQVDGRPFIISEWAHVFPNEYGLEGPALIAAWGIGLQGWDASCIFTDGMPGVFPAALGKYPHDMMAPQIIGMFPVVARQVLRGDVKTATRTITRSVNIAALDTDGKPGFDDQGRVDGDVKEYDGRTVPPEALALARNVIRFTPTFRATAPFNPFAPATTTGGGLDKDGVFISSTRELRWKPRDARSRGWATINTPGTQAAIGFIGGNRFEFDDLAIEALTPGFCAVYATARNRDENIAGARGGILVCTLARARNSDTPVDAIPVLLKNRPDGGANAGPVLMEPVKAILSFKSRLRRGDVKVRILDHGGRDTGRVTPVGFDGSIVLDGAKTGTFYYLITFG
jgi:hypothetical protein